MNGAKLRERLSKGEAITMFNPHHVSPGLSVRLVELGADSIFVDCEHGSWGFEDVRIAAQVIRAAGLPSAFAADPLSECQRRWLDGADGRYSGSGPRHRRRGSLRLSGRSRKAADGLDDRDAGGDRQYRRPARRRGGRRVLYRTRRLITKYGIPAGATLRPT